MKPTKAKQSKKLAHVTVLLFAMTCAKQSNAKQSTAKQKAGTCYDLVVRRDMSQAKQRKAKRSKKLAHVTVLLFAVT